MTSARQVASDAEEILDEATRGRSSTAGALSLEEAITKEKSACLRFEATEQALSTTWAWHRGLREEKRVLHRGARAVAPRTVSSGTTIRTADTNIFCAPLPNSSTSRSADGAASILEALAFPVLIRPVLVRWLLHTEYPILLPLTY